jgi:hypothetical protein
MPQTLNAEIEYDEYPDVSEEWVERSNQAVRTIECAWADRTMLLQDMLGYSVRTGTALTRKTPEPHPEFGFMYAAEARLLRGFMDHDMDPDLGDVITFERAVYQITYRPRTYEILEDDEIEDGREIDRYVTRRKQFAVYSQIIPGTGFKIFGTNPAEVIAQSGTINVPTIALTYTWHQVPIDGIPYAAIEGRLGKVNAGIFDDNYEDEKVLFHSVQEDRYTTANGDRVADLIYLFHYRPVATWNEIPRRDGTYARVEAIDRPGEGIYGIDTLYELFALEDPDA